MTTRPKGRGASPHGSPYDEALALMSADSPDLGRVEKLLESARDSGDARAGYALGTWYLHGHHVTKNLRKALMFLREAAESEVPEALYDLAICYEKGVGVAQNLPMALRLYLRAALVGEKQSIYEVGRCYYYGLGVEKDRRVAAVWLDRAESLGIKG